MPDDLHEEVQAANIEVSKVCQSALRLAVADRHRTKQEQLAVLQAARRIALTAKAGPLRKAEGRREGRRWAADSATMGDLELLSEYVSDWPVDYVVEDGSTKLIMLDSFESLREWLLDLVLPNPRVFDDADRGRTHWVMDDFTEGFIEAAKEFWAEVQTLLEEPEASREQRAAALQSDAWGDEPPF